MNSLSATDLAHLQTAQGLCKQNQSDAALNALALISSEQQNHHEVLELRWEIAAQAADWPGALSLAEALQKTHPDPAHAVLCLACSLAELDRTQEALQTLSAAHARFPESPAIAYNAACCASKLGLVSDAKDWIHKAIATGGRAEVKLMALGDPDLEPLVDYLCAM